MEETGYMAKMRVHELAKELGIDNKKIIEFLSTTEHAVKTHSSSVEEHVQELVRKKFGRSANNSKETDAVRKQQGAAPEKSVSPEPRAERPAGENRTAGAPEGSRPQGHPAGEEKKSGTDTAAGTAEKHTEHSAGRNANRPEGNGAKQNGAKSSRPENGQGKGADRPKKKSSITSVFNAQYSKQGSMHGGRRQGGQGNGRPQGGQGNGRPQGERDRRPGQGDRRPQGGRTWRAK